jgi:hypothetical protein
MKAYKVELLIVNHDGLSEREIKIQLENVNYPNDCISPSVMKIEGKDIGEWHDDHPLNKNKTMEKEYNKLFKSQP